MTDRVQEAAGYISVLDDLRPMDRGQFNAAYEIWKVRMPQENYELPMLVSVRQVIMFFQCICVKVAFDRRSCLPSAIRISIPRPKHRDCRHHTCRNSSEQVCVCNALHVTFISSGLIATRSRTTRC